MVSISELCLSVKVVQEILDRQEQDGRFISLEMSGYD